MSSYYQDKPGQPVRDRKIYKENSLSFWLLVPYKHMVDRIYVHMRKIIETILVISLEPGWV